MFRKRYAFGRFKCPFGGPFLLQMPCIFRTLFKHRSWACVLHVSLIFRTAGPSKNIVFLQLNTCFSKFSIFSIVSEKHRFHTLLGLIFRQFWHQFSIRFRCRFFVDFRSRFGNTLGRKWVQNGSQKRPKIAPKTHPKNHRKNDADLQPRGVPGSPPLGAPPTHS